MNGMIFQELMLLRRETLPIRMFKDFAERHLLDIDWERILMMWEWFLGIMMK